MTARRTYTSPDAYDQAGYDDRQEYLAAADDYYPIEDCDPAVELWVGRMEERERAAARDVADRDRWGS